ncbi:MAG: two-component regulator propeller domain-containing protein [Acidobacteriaceae bacterium]|nr:two-component regulator propeller domain-containing protein [Acidobacteriaceae bacterium]
MSRGVVRRAKTATSHGGWLLCLLLLLVRGPLLLHGESKKTFSEPHRAPFGSSIVRLLPPEAVLSQVRVAQILQDDLGFLWMGTQYGLNRYDGVHMQQYLHDPSNPNSLGGSYVQALYKDRGGFLWISTDQSLDRYDPSTETFHHYDLQFPGSSKHYFVHQICEDASGILWLGTGGGLIRFDPVSSVYELVNKGKSGEHLFAENDIKALELDREGHFWIATRTQIVLFDPVAHSVLKRIATEFSPAATFMHEDVHGNFWAIVRNHLYRMDQARTRLDPVVALGGVQLSEYGELRAMMEDRTGDMWFGTEYSGVLHFKQDSNIVEIFAHQPGRSGSLPSERVIALFQDQRGDVWVGFHDMPPCMILRGEVSFRSTTYNPDAMTGLYSPLVTAIFEESSESMLIGTSEILQRQNLSTGEMTRPYPFLDGNDVLSIYRDREQRLWFGTDKGLYRLDTKGQLKRFGRQDRHEAHLSGAHVQRIFNDDGDLWVATWGGIDRYDPVTDSFTTVLELEHGENIYDAVVDRDHSIWLGTNRGVEHFFPNNQSLTSYRYKSGREQGPSDTRINTLLVDAVGTLWVGTQSGLDRFNRQTQHFQRVTQGIGFGGQVVSCLQEDADHHLWMGTNQGLLRFTPATSTFEQFSTIDGLPGMDLTGWGVCSKGGQSRMYFGGFSGAVSFLPSVAHRSSFTPHVAFTDLVIDGSAVKAGETPFLPKAIAYTQRLSLPHESNSFTLEFASLDFRDARAERFRYKLEGLDNGWNPIASGQRSLSFSRLPRKHYVLRLQTSIGGENSWKESLTLPIDIAPPWWARWWMLLLYLVAVASILILEWNRKLQQVREVYEARIEGRVRERTKLARDLHDTLLQDIQGLILRFQSYLLQMGAEDGKRQALTAILNRAEESVIDSRDAIQDLRTNPIDVAQLADAFGEYAEELSFLSHARAVVESDTAALAEHDFDVEELFQIGREAIRNAFQHAQASLVRIRISYVERRVRLLVEDNGIGMSSDLLEYGVEGHWGIRGMRERAERGGFTLQIRSRHIDGRGTEVVVTTPRQGFGRTIFLQKLAHRLQRLFQG